MKTGNEKKTGALTEGSIGKLLFRLTVPMIFGTLSMVIFNLIDAFFVGRLGTNELAALSFTYPVVLVIGSLAMGLGIGSSAVISRAIGEGDQNRVQCLTTNGLILSLVFVAIFVVIGLFSIKPLFRLLGATPEILPLIRTYMLIWYPGVIFVIIPMVGNNAIRATGDTKTPSMIMISAAVVNAVLDPVLIFGIGPFPRLELAGAAIATVFARATALFFSLYVLWHREKMITLRLEPVKCIIDAWKKILYIGIPTAGSRIIIPLGTGIITGLVARYGPEPVAAFGVAARIDFFAMSVIMSLSAVLGPFVGQNLGAFKIERIRKGVNKSTNFSVFWGLLMFVVFMIFARKAALIFSKNEQVISVITLYLRIVSVGYGLQGVLHLSTIALNVLNKPLHASALMILQMFIIYIPLGFTGSYLFGLPGIFGALTVSYFVAGFSGHLVLKRTVRTVEKKMPEKSF